ncbi:hypothetical protein NQK81_39735 [Amycolatopsis roodepoortensis]|uniref:hypothetical protein n=1 Tax=Amycolatopsis roodepoortensis TaxID=700274 RepID=UPI00214CA439|nr:hypothetical protein [Amycolatopsis roodepoortensis]UUV30831.1 hypothetical protein NQK81_39735 [Amycolatopsis roodepoortensis]
MPSTEAMARIARASSGLPVRGLTSWILRKTGTGTPRVTVAGAVIVTFTVLPMSVPLT